MKHLIGKTIYLEPTGNNFRRGTPLHEQELEAVEVIKVHRVNIVVRNRYGHEKKYRMSECGDMAVYSDGLNAGYIIHESRDAFFDSIEAARIGSAIIADYRYGDAFRCVDLKDMKTIAGILGVDIPEPHPRKDQNEN